jgi:AAA+ ATPase superfamily predicted ATPase
MDAVPGGMPMATFGSFNDALTQLFELACEERLIFVIDEYPYLLESYPAISSLLQHLIDRYQSESRLFLILNGSSMTQMTAEFFANNRPLYGRKTFQIKLKPFRFFEFREHFPQTDPDLLPLIYAVYGGIPKYFKGYRQEKSLKQNIIASFLSIGSPLLDEPEAVLKQEVREPSVYNTVFTAIAQGAHKYSELSAKAGISSGNITRHLETLTFLDLIRREVPAYSGEQKKALYRIDDNMFRFWYRFVARSLSLVNFGRPEIAYRIIDENLNQFMGEVFERICLEYLWLQNGSGSLPFDFTEAGRWWGGNPKTKTESEIDILAHDGTNGLFCECKWSDRQVGTDVLAALDNLAILPQFSALRQKHTVLFAKKGFTEACVEAAACRSDVILVTMAELLA